MASRRPEIVDWLNEVFAPLGPIALSRLFGGWQFKCHGLAFAVVLNDILYFRAGPALGAALAAEGAEPFRYAKAGKTVTVGRFMSAPDAAMDDEAALLAWAERALAGAADLRR